MIHKPAPSEFPEFYGRYINLVNGDPLRLLESQVLTIQSLVSEIASDKEDYAYAEGKWTIREVIGHMTDCERIMAYRALRFSRNDQTELPGFEEDDYVAASNFNQRSLYDLAHELCVVRESNLAMVKSLTPEMLDRKGTANGKPISVRALVYVLAWHVAHHVGVIRERYL